MQAGLAAEFFGPDELRAAVRRLRDGGYTLLDAYTPCPVPGLQDELGISRPRLNWFVFVAGMGGVAFALFVQWFTNAFDYPINVGGRPLFAVPAFVPIMFETGVLFATLTGFVLFFWSVRLPRLHQRLFDLPDFESASIDRYWLAVSAADPQFEATATRADLEATGPVRVAGIGGVL